MCKQVELGSATTLGSAHMLLDSLNVACDKAFGKRLEPGAGVSDHCPAYFNAFEQAFPGMPRMQCYPHIARKLAEGEYCSKTWEHFDAVSGHVRAIHLAMSAPMRDLLLRESGAVWDKLDLGRRQAHGQILECKLHRPVGHVVGRPLRRPSSQIPRYTCLTHRLGGAKICLLLIRFDRRHRNRFRFRSAHGCKHDARRNGVAWGIPRCAAQRPQRYAAVQRYAARCAPIRVTRAATGNVNNRPCDGRATRARSKCSLPFVLRREFSRPFAHPSDNFRVRSEFLYAALVRDRGRRSWPDSRAITRGWVLPVGEDPVVVRASRVVQRTNERGTATGLTGSPALDVVWYGTEGVALGLSSQTTTPSLEGVSPLLFCVCFTF